MNYVKIDTDATNFHSESSSNGTFDCHFISGLIWPLTIIIIIAYYRKDIKNMINSITSRINDGSNIEFGNNIFKIGSSLSREEVRAKAEVEYQDSGNSINSEGDRPDLDKDETKTSIKEEYVRDLLNIEAVVADTVRKFYSDRYRIITNYRIKSYEYDIILDAPVLQDNDKVIEIRYFKFGTNAVYIREALIRLYVFLDAYRKTLKRNADAILIVIIPQLRYKENEIDEFMKLPEKMEYIPSDNLSIFFYKEEELNNLTKDQFNIIDSKKR